MAKKHRAEILKDLTSYITNQQAEAVILASDINKNAYSQEIEQFLIMNRLINVYEVINGLIDSKNRDSACKHGSLAIDIVTMSTNLIEHVDGSKLINFSDIIITDHRGFLIDMNLEDFF